MEKIWIKKELYFSSSEFVKFFDFLPIFNLIFNEFLMICLLLKSRKRGFIYLRTAELTWRAT